MSLEQQIAALVDASNNLTGAINGKVKEIDKAVDDAVTGIPQAIADNLYRVVYLDQTNGSDSNDGTYGKPVQSMRSIANKTPAGGSLDIRLLSDYVFEETEDASFTNAQVRILSHDENRRKIKFNTSKTEDGKQVLRGFFSRRGGLFNFYNINLELPDMPSVPGTFSTYSCVIASHFGDDMGVPLSVRINGVEVIVPTPETNNFMFLANFDGLNLVSVGNCTFDAAWINRDKFFYGGSSLDTLKASRIITKNDVIPQG